MYLSSILFTDGLVTFTDTLWIWYYNIALLFSLVGCWNLPFIGCILLSCYLWRTLSIANMGYLHCPRTSSRCCNPLVSSCALVHTVLALRVRVLITLYLDARLLWLSHWRYKSHNTLSTIRSVLTWGSKKK